MNNAGKACARPDVLAAKFRPLPSQATARSRFPGEIKVSFVQEVYTSNMDSIRTRCRKNAQKRAYSYIKEQIVNLQLVPGRKLRAQEFAGILNLSRTPVREALGRLEQERLVHRDSGWGYVVEPITFKEILDLLKIRESLEVLAAVEAIPNLDAAGLRRLKSILDKSAGALKAGRHAQFRAASREFHMAISSVSGIPLLHQIMLGINDRIRQVAALQVDVRRDRAHEILAENRRILGSLGRKNARQVRSAVLAHIGNARNGLLKFANLVPSMFEHR